MNTYQRNSALMRTKFREYLIPSLLTSMAISLASIVDSVIVGKLLGELALSAIGLSAPAVYAMNSLFLLFVIGGVTNAAIAKGERDDASANRFFTATFLFGLVMMAVLAIALLIFLRPLTDYLAHGDALLARQTFDYLVWLAPVGPVMLLIMGMGQFARADGKPGVAAQIAIIANVVKLALEYVFIQWMHMGINGASLSTLIGFLCGILVLIPYLRSEARTFRFVRPGAAVLRALKNMLLVGMPEASTDAMCLCYNAVLNVLLVRHYGAMGMAAMTVCINCLVFTNIFIQGINDTLLPITGTLFGERDFAGIRFAARSSFLYLISASTLMAALILLLPRQIGALFGVTSPDGLAITQTALRLYALSLPVFGVNELLKNLFQTTGRPKFALMLPLTMLLLICASAPLLAQGPYVWLCFLIADICVLAMVLLWSHIKRRAGNAVGILALPASSGDEPTLDVSIPATVEDAVQLSQEVIGFCQMHHADGKSANRMGLAVEEMACNIAQYGSNKKRSTIDVAMRIADGDLILRLRDNGPAFDPTTYSAAEQQAYHIGGIQLVKQMSSGIDYTRQLGFNVTIITIPFNLLLAQS